MGDLTPFATSHRFDTCRPCPPRLERAAHDRHTIYLDNFNPPLSKRANFIQVVEVPSDHCSVFCRHFATLLCFGARVLQVTLKQGSEIYIPLLDHNHTLSEQIAQAAVCDQFHMADQRLARWLL